MVYRKFHDLDISLLGFGCMRLPFLHPEKEDINEDEAQRMIDFGFAHGVNYFDTAIPYHGGLSEGFLGNALSKYPRKNYFLATKILAHLAKNHADMERIFNEQLERCKTDYFDFYLCHAFRPDTYQSYVDLDVAGFLDKKKQQGKIKNIGFSFHATTDILRQACDLYPWDFAQIQMNYLDWELQDAKTQYEILAERNIPTIVMEPIRGGALANLGDASNAILKAERPDMSIASWALRFAASFPNIITVLSGMSTLAQTKENVVTIENFEPLSERELACVNKAVSIFREHFSVPCTACRYCSECPMGIDIPTILELLNQYNMTDNRFEFNVNYNLIKKEARAHMCTGCGTCASRCPQNIGVPEQLKKVVAVLGEGE